MYLLGDTPILRSGIGTLRASVVLPQLLIKVFTSHRNKRHLKNLTQGILAPSWQV
jgi:hypothetical protein